MPPKNSRIAVLLCTIVLALAHPEQALGQNQDSVLINVLRDAQHRGRYVRITTDSIFEGRMTTIEGRNVRLVGAVTAIRDIPRVEFRERHGGGAKLGAVIGSLVVAVPVTAMIAAFSDDGDASTLAGGLLSGVLIGGPVGGIIGAVADPAKGEWTVVWPL
jgi:hypothetical protein